jgi:hypothetical protein
MAKDMETEKHEDSILSPPLKKSFLDSASKNLAREIAQIWTGPDSMGLT